MSTTRLGIIALILIACLAALALINTVSIPDTVPAAQTQQVKPTATADISSSSVPSDSNLNPVVLPLYEGITWYPEEPAVINAQTDMNPTDASLTGVMVISNPSVSTMSPAAVAAPFEKYYNDKLAAAGWQRDPSLDAGGPASSFWVYRNGNDLISFSYSSTFANVSKNTPSTCPCTLTFRIFSATVE